MQNGWFARVNGKVFMPLMIDGGGVSYPPIYRPVPTPPPVDDRCAAPLAVPGQTYNPELKPIDVPRGPNDLHMSLEGPDPDLAVGGSHDQQEAQRDVTLDLADDAARSYAGRWLPIRQSDADVNAKLNGLQRNPPIGTDGVEVTHAVYTSEVPNADAQQLFDHWVNHPSEVFNAGGMEIRPASAQLVDGGRYMLETAAAGVPTWLPVEISVDAQAHSITIHTLDGHVLRGEQTFSFVDNGCGGTTIVQDARFQAGSQVVGDLQTLASVSEGQHQAWVAAHRESWEQFNGDRDYAGIGIGLGNSEQRRTIVDFVQKAVLEPGVVANGVIDVGGDLGNGAIDWGGRRVDESFDGAGRIVSSAMDRANVPGGDVVEAGYDAVGDGVEFVADKTGDGVEFVADKTGDAVGAAVDWATPW
jgi:hypothetical protein